MLVVAAVTVVSRKVAGTSPTTTKTQYGTPTSNRTTCRATTASTSAWSSGSPTAQSTPSDARR